jgi:anion-transporting  ArsA/GET3 family ATPase
MTSVLQQKLLVVTGKGGVGKTTVAAAIGLLAADRGLRTIIVEVGEQHRLSGLFGLGPPSPGVERELQNRLSSISIDPDRALLEWLQTLGGRVPGRVLASSGTFQYFAAAAPGAKELVGMVKIWELTQPRRRRGRGSDYDLVVFDAPATGHALGMLSSPRTFGAIARVGPIAAQAQRLAELLADPERCGYLAVAHASEMAITETLELQDSLRKELGRDLEAVVVNGLLPRRFTDAELGRITRLTDGQPMADHRVAPRAKRSAGQGSSTRARAPERIVASDAVARSTARAAHAVHDRARLQRNQVARLRRRGLHILGVPYQFDAELDLPSIRRIADHLGRKL